MEAPLVGEPPPDEEPTDEDANDVRETKLDEVVVPLGGFPPCIISEGKVDARIEAHTVDARHWEYQSFT